MATDKQRIVADIQRYSPMLCTELYNHFRGEDSGWKIEELANASLPDLVRLRDYLRKTAKDIEDSDKAAQKMERDSSIPEDQIKIAEPVSAKGAMDWELRFWDDQFLAKPWNNNRFSQIVAYQIVANSLQGSINEDLELLKQKKPMRDGMSKTEVKKILAAIDVVKYYMFAQLREARPLMVEAKKAQNALKEKPAEKKVDIKIAGPMSVVK